MTKTLKNLLNHYAAHLEPIDSQKLIKWDLREGKAFVLSSIKKVSEMKCLRCGNDRGMVCRHEGNEYFAWFCIKDECIRDSVEKSKLIARKKYEEEYWNRLQYAAIEMKKKKQEQKKEIKFKFSRKSNDD